MVRKRSICPLPLNFIFPKKFCSWRVYEERVMEFNKVHSSSIQRPSKPHSRTFQRSSRDRHGSNPYRVGEIEKSACQKQQHWYLLKYKQAVLKGWFEIQIDEFQFPIHFFSINPFYQSQPAALGWTTSISDFPLDQPFTHSTPIAYLPSHAPELFKCRLVNNKW